MKSALAKIKFGFGLLFVFATLAASAQDLPTPLVPKQIVNDYVGLLQSHEKNELETRLLAFNDTSSTQVAVVIISSTNGYPISDYAFKLGEKWGVGQNGMDNGVVFLIAKDDRKTFIATGYGVEEYLTDALCKRIIETQVLPAFRQNDFYGGINAGVNSILGYLSGKFKADDNLTSDDEINPIVIIVIFLVIIIIISMFNRNNRGMTMNRRGWTSTSSSPPWIFTGGGGSGGSSGGGGGFGGFGGGSFGGGGAGGSW